jgi:D-glycero-D-manno-heptose 1,7-bisphosphate phosphatase
VGSLKAAAFLDRDGVLNELVPDTLTGEPESPLGPGGVVLVEGAAQGALALRRAGYLLIGVSNQPAAAKALASLDALARVQERVLELLAAEGVRFDAFEICHHHPAGVIPELTGVCDCRKPAPGMLLRAARRLRVDLASSWMIGDTDTDVAAGQAAGCHTLLIEYAGSAHKRNASAAADLRAANLQAAAALLLGRETR